MVLTYVDTKIPWVSGVIDVFTHPYYLNPKDVLQLIGI